MIAEKRLSILGLALWVSACAGSLGAPNKSDARTPSTSASKPALKISGNFPQADQNAVIRLLADVDAALVVVESNTGRAFRYNVARTTTRFSPCSTFKIPNTLIGLETGAVLDADTRMPWDQTKHPQHPFWDELKAMGYHWAQDQSLRSAFQQSVVWFYQDIAEKVGLEKMAVFLNRFNYGNQDISGGLTTFWLGSTLGISAEEQVAFLQNFYFDQLGLSARTAQIAKDVFAVEKGDNYVLSAKTGTGTPEDGGPGIAWYVGYVEKDGRVYFFAFNLSGSNFSELSQARNRLSREALIALHLLPKGQ